MKRILVLIGLLLCFTAAFADTQDSKSSSNSPQGISDTSLNLDDAKRKCISLGFKEKTEQFGKCVLQLSK